MRIQRQAWPAHSLLNRAHGIAASDVQRALGVSPVGRVEALESRVNELERHLAFFHRHWQGIELNDARMPVVPDDRGWMQMYSDDDSITIERKPNTNPTIIDLTVTTPGCVAAITTNIDCDAGSVTATACGATVQHTSGNNYVAVHVAGTANAQTLTYWFCAPACAAPAGYIGGDSWYSQLGPPVGFVAVPVGDPCTGGCSAVAVPYWAPGAP